jgi:hypothetical protein
MTQALNAKRLLEHRTFEQLWEERGDRLAITCSKAYWSLACRSRRQPPFIHVTEEDLQLARLENFSKKHNILVLIRALTHRTKELET